MALVYMPETGQLVEMEDDLLGVVTEIQRRWPNLSVKYLENPEGAELTDPPYLIMETDKLGKEVVVLRVWSLDKRVIQQLEASDTHKIDVAASLEKARQDRLRKVESAKEEHHGEAKDKMLHLFRNPKTTYSFTREDGSLLKIADG